VNEASVKEILKALVAEVENLRASQAVAIATLQKHLKVSDSDVQRALEGTRFSNQSHYDKLRKAVDEISS
jgi:hypothetical protein